jgi:hypothetical protein
MDDKTHVFYKLVIGSDFKLCRIDASGVITEIDTSNSDVFIARPIDEIMESKQKAQEREAVYKQNRRTDLIVSAVFFAIAVGIVFIVLSAFNRG